MYEWSLYKLVSPKVTRIISASVQSSLTANAAKLQGMLCYAQHIFRTRPSSESKTPHLQENIALGRVDTNAADCSET